MGFRLLFDSQLIELQQIDNFLTDIKLIITFAVCIRYKYCIAFYFFK